MEIHDGSLGYMVNRTKSLMLNTKNEKRTGLMIHTNLPDETIRFQTRRWTIVLVTLCVLFVTIQLSLLLVINYVIHPFVSTPNTEKIFIEFENPWNEIVEDTIPFVQNWMLQEKKSGPSLLQEGDIEQATSSLQSKSKDTSSDSCVDLYYKGLKEFIPMTSPLYIKLVLQNLGDHMYRSPSIQTILKDLLSEPRNLKVMYEESQRCLSNNFPFAELACAVHKIHGPPNLADEKTRTIFQYAVNFAVVLEVLTKYIEKDLQVLNEVAEAIISSCLSGFKSFLDTAYTDKQEIQEKTFYWAKYRSMALAMKILRDSKANNAIVPNVSPNEILQLNILEAVKLDIQYGHNDNAKVGMALAANSNAGSFIESTEIISQLNKEYIDSYIAWNFAFILGSRREASDTKLGNMLIPSITCTSDSYVKDRFLQRQIISSSLSTLHIYKSPARYNVSDNTTITENEASILDEFYRNLRVKNTTLSMDNDLNNLLSTNIGKSNSKNVILTDLDKNTIFRMLYNICGEKCYGQSWMMSESSPTSILFEENDDFFAYLGFMNWITVVLTGIGLEMFMILVYIKHEWTNVHENQWKIAQFLFSILTLVSVGLASSRNYWSLLTIVIGFWKFGFPETVVPMYCALFDTAIGVEERVHLSIEAAGALIHHSAAALALCMFLTGTITPNRSIYDPTLVLCAQHWFVLLRYFHNTLYLSVEILLEVWFEWTVFSSFEQYTSNHWTLELAAAGLLFAHWIWFLSGGVRLSLNLFKSKKVKNIVN